MLVVEDERHIRDLVALHLQLEGWVTTAAGDGHEALRLAREERFDLVILDLMLPGLDGWTVLRAIRRESINQDVPVLLLTARREEADKVLGLESGADDYLTKPFGVRELVARARALTRRRRPLAETTAAGASPPAVRFQHVVIDPARRRASVDGRDVDLTAREFDLLYLLLSNPGIVFSRATLLARVWKGEAYVTERSVDTLVKRLRRKIERDPPLPRSSSRCGALGTEPPMSDPLWYRSLYWRIGLGFIVCVTGLLVAQGLLFLWLTGRGGGPLGDQSPQRLAELVASDISAALDTDPELNVDEYVQRQFGRVRQPFLVVLADGRLVQNREFALRRPLVRAARLALRRSMAFEPRRRSRRFEGPHESSRGEPWSAWSCRSSVGGRLFLPCASMGRRSRRRRSRCSWLEPLPWRSLSFARRATGSGRSSARRRQLARATPARARRSAAVTRWRCWRGRSTVWRRISMPALGSCRPPTARGVSSSRMCHTS